jgi:hypothetical protein
MKPLFWTICEGAKLHGNCFSCKDDDKEENLLKYYGCLEKSCSKRYCHACGKIYLEQKKEAETIKCQSKDNQLNWVSKWDPIKHHTVIEGHLFHKILEEYYWFEKITLKGLDSFYYPRIYPISEKYLLMISGSQR